tara:strand:+ start:166 stop:516 length:351 start_codon:yes stop_codon:yes gene_type:complete
MCIGGRPAYAVPQRQESSFKDAPPVVTGTQTGVDNPKDTKKATENLKIKRQKKEGTYVDPNLSRTEALLTKRGGGGSKTAQQKANLARNKAKAKAMARARLSRKSRMSGSRSRGTR